MTTATLEIGLREGRTAFEPGEEVAGAVRWELDAPPARAEVRLCWWAHGRGAEDVSVVEVVAFDAPQAGEMRSFSFRAPGAPWSFSGKLITLSWVVEVVLQPGAHYRRVEIVIAPGGRPVELPQIEQPPRESSFALGS
jgi:hypothetical protein